MVVSEISCVALKFLVPLIVIPEEINLFACPVTKKLSPTYGVIFRSGPTKNFLGYVRGGLIGKNGDKSYRNNILAK